MSIDFRRIPLDLAEFSAVVSDSDIPLKDRLLDQYSPNPPHRHENRMKKSRR
ncbi:MAG: hypothetical protein V3V52_06260 [Candidatus Adiutricales bacterium]